MTKRDLLQGNQFAQEPDDDETVREIPAHTSVFHRPKH